ncbi:MAG: hypothetical protein HYT76_07495 [Deltaproteobacteria bacterium]|nr:hypothetical protein [Deltaproteobacteria bacterium]
MKRTRKILFVFFILPAALLAACAGGGKDEPYLFPSIVPSEGTPAPSGEPQPDEGVPCEDNSNCPEGQVCREGTCTAETEVVCTEDSECEEGKICKIGEDEKGTCIEGCRTNEQCEDGEQCTENNTCQPVIGGNLCETQFEATLTLYIDASLGTSDAPSACNNYPSPPHTDLFCCHSTSDTATPLNGEERFCARAETLALTRFLGSQPMKMKFDFSNGCKVYVAAVDFPGFRLDNTALEAALIIDAGATYDRLKDHIAVSDCHETENGGIAIDSLPLQFMIRLYDNFNRCQILGEDDCVGPAYSRWFSDFSPTTNPPPNQSFQIIPGLSKEFLHLTTDEIEITPVPGTVDVGPVRISGSPTTFDASAGETRMTLVTGLIVPEGTSSDPDQGTGQLGAALGNAVMAAEITGILRNPAKEDGTIESLSDLRENCGGGGGGGGTPVLNLTASVATPLGQGELLSEDLPVVRDANGKITIDLCLPGTHQQGNCIAVPTSDLPFAKEDGDPLFPGIEERFIQQATVTLTIGAGSNQNLDLNVPDQVGPLKIVNAHDLNTAIFAPIVNSAIALQLEFHPELAGQGCSSSGGQVTCSSEVRISENPEVTLSLHGFGRPPAPSIEISELNLSEPGSGGTPLAVHSSTPPTITFSEQIVGIQTENKLLRVSNNGVRTLEVTSIEAQDLNLNFRVGAIYQGESFEEREWRGNRDQWSVPPDGRRDLFFFLNYGPFAKPVITSADRRRTDHTLLKVEGDGINPATAVLSGIAKQDRRGTLSLYLQDESRFIASGVSCDPTCPEGIDQLVISETETDHLFRASNFLASFRQDGAEKALYLKNDGISGTEDIVMASRPQFSGTDIGKFCIKWTDLGETACHTDGSGDEGTETPPLTFSLAAGEKRKIATIQFDVPEGSSNYRVFEAQFDVNAYSGRPGNRPKIGGVPSDSGNSTQITFNMKGSNGAPDGTRNLIVHRLMAGMDKRLSDSLQRTRILTTATRGILDRAGITDITRYLDRFTLPGGIRLDPVSGTAILKPIFTTPDPDRNNPVAATNPSFNGVRIYNTIGSDPSRTEYRFQCENASGHSCSYFYLYLSDWEAADQSPSCGGGKVTVTSSNFSNILNPAIASEADCIQSYYNETDSPALATGTYDPVTGEISFSNLAVRLFSPVVPALGNDPIDAVLQLALTTECISSAFIPDQAAQSKRLVPEATLNDPGTGCGPCFDTLLMGLEGRNPISPYVEGPRCADPDELHGRRLLEPDTSGTFDRGAIEGELPAGSLTMDLAGVARIASPNPQAQGTMMYIIIKAEID